MPMDGPRGNATNSVLDCVSQGIASRVSQGVVFHWALGTDQSSLVSLSPVWTVEAVEMHRLEGRLPKEMPRIGSAWGRQRGG